MDIIKVEKINDGIKQESEGWKEEKYSSPTEFELEIFHDLSFVVIDGEAQLTVNGTEYNLKKDDLVSRKQFAKSSWKIDNSFKFNIINTFFKYYFFIHI